MSTPRHAWEKLAVHHYRCTRCGMDKTNAILPEPDARGWAQWQAQFSRDGETWTGTTPPCPGTLPEASAAPACGSPEEQPDPEAQSLLAFLAARLKPRARLSVSDWSDAHRVLSPKASSQPGPWRTASMPHTREIMDALSLDDPTPRISVMKPAQAAVTESSVNWVGYIMDYVRSAKPTLIVVPTDRLLVRWVHQRLRPMVEGAACLRGLLDVSRSRDGTNRLDMIDYPGGLIYLTTAGSAANLKSDSICYAICDEADEYDWDVEGRGDPLGMIESRMANFPRRKLLIFSTPTVKGASRIEGEYLASDQRRLHVACPHCGERQTLEWEHLHWDEGLARVWYTCARNGCVIEEREKPGMLASAIWIPTYPERSAKHKGYHFNALYSPLGLGYSWPELAQQWIDAQGKPEKLQAFANERLALPWEDRRTQIDVDDLVRRAETYPMRAVQPGGLLLSAGVDTQDDRLVVQIIAWGAERDWWVLDYVELPGDPTSATLWEALTALLARPIMTGIGTEAYVEATCIDMGGHHTEDVKAYVRESRLPRCMAILGSRHRLDVPLGRPRKTDYSPRGSALRWGMKYYPVGTEICKDRVYGDLRTDTEKAPPDRRGHFSAELPPEYYAGLLSEIWNPKRNRYEPRRGMTRRNEPLDTWVYAYAAAHHPELRLDRLRPIDWSRRAEALWRLPLPQPDPDPDAPAPVSAAQPEKSRPADPAHDLFSPISMT